MVEYNKNLREIDFNTIGLVFPVHAWGLPEAVIKFVMELKPALPAYVFAIAVNAGQVSATLLQLARILRRKAVVLLTGFSITMPSHYIPWGGHGPKAE